MPAELRVALPGAAPAGPADGSAQRPFPTIAAAVLAARDGDTLLLGEGDYTEAVVLDRPLTLRGRGAALTRLVAPPESRWPKDPEVPVVRIRGDRPVTLAGLTVVEGAVGIEITGSGEPAPGAPWRPIEPGPSHLLTDVSLARQYLTGLRLRGARVIYRGGALSEIGPRMVGLGIEGWGSRLEASGLSLRRIGRRGLELRATVALLEGLDASPAGPTAVQVLDGCDVVVRGGRFTGHSGAALFVAGARLRLEGVHLEDNDYGAIAARAATLELEGGEVLGHRVAGVAFVNSGGALWRTHLSRGGTEGALSVLQSTGPVVLEDVRIDAPGPNGLHLTRATLVLRRSEITGANKDRQGDFGDGIYALESDLLLDRSTLSANAGTGVTLNRSALQIIGTVLDSNGRAGIWLTDRSSLRATGNRFTGNRSGIEVGELSTASLGGNRFSGNKEFAIDGACGQSQVLELIGGNSFEDKPGTAHRTCQ
jgi:parallel beta-helix repeat protein